MSLRLPIIAHRTIAKAYYVHEARFSQVAERIVNRGIADRRESLARGLEDVAGGRVILTLKYHLQHSLPLRGKFLPANCFFSASLSFHSRLRLILNWRTCQAPSRDDGGRGDEETGRVSPSPCLPF